MKKIKINQNPPTLRAPSLEKGGLKNGFTLIELLMVIIIIGILTIASASSYRTAQIKARDTERKSSLEAVFKSLMMYYNDNGSFPNLTSSQLFGNEDGFNGANNLIYMRKTPEDPRYPDYRYWYKPSVDFKQFALFANLENTDDSQCQVGLYNVGGQSYCYGISSPNTTPEDISDNY